MSEEEKEAIEYLKNKHIYFDEYEACEDFETENKIDIVLNLIDRLQKELEQEKEKNKALEHLLELKRKRIKKLSELIEECSDDE